MSMKNTVRVCVFSLLNLNSSLAWPSVLSAGPVAASRTAPAGTGFARSPGTTERMATRCWRSSSANPPWLTSGSEPAQRLLDGRSCSCGSCRARGRRLPATGASTVPPARRRLSPRRRPGRSRAEPAQRSRRPWRGGRAAPPPARPCPHPREAGRADWSRCPSQRLPRAR